MLRNSWLLVLCALVALSSAFNLDGVEEYIHHGVKRQASGTGNNSPTPNPPTSSAAPPPASTPRATPTPVTSNPPDNASSAPPPAQSSQAPPASSTRGNQGTPARSTTGNAPASTPPPAASSAAPRSSAVIRTSDFVSTSVAPFTTTLTSTLSDGGISEIVSTGMTSVPVTSRMTYTDAPTSQENNGGNGGSLSDSNKKVIGGVVGGVGGALLLGGIALVFWRMKKRQNKVTVDDDDLTLNTGAALGDKPQNGPGPSPFQSNLEQYHNPGGRPNAAANF